MSQQVKLGFAVKKIQGGISLDGRGQIRYVNEFDMSLVKRFYIIKNSDTELIRGWRGHRIERRWFYVLSGSFELNLVKIDDWDEPSVNLPIEKIKLTSDDLQIVYLPMGHASAFRALEENSELLVFADFSLDHAPFDNYIWPIDYFIGLKEIHSST